MVRYAVMGLSIVAGAALIEAALAPAVLLGGAVMLAPAVLPKVRRVMAAAVESLTSPAATPQSPPPQSPQHQSPQQQLAATHPLAILPKLAVKQAVAKTITFRIIVTTLDFTTNYVILGELATAAGLSPFSLVVGPLFYFAHEAAWNYLALPGDRIALPVAPSDASPQRHTGFAVSRALAKTITFRAFATVMDFTTNFVVVGDLMTAVSLSATGFVIGPFVYWGHEKAWDYFGQTPEPRPEPGGKLTLPRPIAAAAAV